MTKYIEKNSLLQEREKYVKSLLRDFSYAIKKNKQFANFVRLYKPFEKKYSSYDMLASMRTIHVKIGKHLFFHGTLNGFTLSEINSNLFARICLLKTWLVPRSYNHIDLPPNDLLEVYTKEEIQKHHIKVYPNNVVFAVTIGAIFALIGFFSISLLLWRLYGFLGCLIYGCFVSMVIAIKPLKD